MLIADTSILVILVIVLHAAASHSAILALKRKKYQENLLEKTYGQMHNLEELVNHIEFASVQKDVFDALKAGNDTLQSKPTFQVPSAWLHHVLKLQQHQGSSQSLLHELSATLILCSIASVMNVHSAEC